VAAVADVWAGDNDRVKMKEEEQDNSNFRRKKEERGERRRGSVVG
jgi:hypothetical protein